MDSLQSFSYAFSFFLTMLLKNNEILTRPSKPTDEAKFRLSPRGSDKTTKKTKHIICARTWKMQKRMTRKHVFCFFRFSRKLWFVVFVWFFWFCQILLEIGEISRSWPGPSGLNFQNLRKPCPGYQLSYVFNDSELTRPHVGHGPSGLNF